MIGGNTRGLIRTVEILLVFLLVALLAACAPIPRPRPYRTWSYSDLRAMDAADAVLPALDLVAAYTRSQGSRLQIRLDLLDSDPLPGYDLYLALDTTPGGTRALPLQANADLDWDTLIVIPASGSIRALDPELHPRPRAAIRISRNPSLDTLDISFNPPAPGFPALGYRLQVFITPAGLVSPTDQLGPVRSSDSPPPQAEVLFAFWDSYPAYTPALALRRWDGAHTGPRGGRHGLYNLLRTARNNRIPLALLDLKNPASLSALDYIGGLNLVRNMAANSLLILPQPLTGYEPQASAEFTFPTWFLARAANENRQSGLSFGLPASPFLYSPAGLPPNDLRGRVVFTHTAPSQELTSTTRLMGWDGKTVIPLPLGENLSDGQPQVLLDGPSLDVRRSLVANALAGSPARQLSRSPILVLGGSLPYSTWGDPQIARASFHYLAAHPWVHPLSAQDLLSSRPALPFTSLSRPGNLTLPDDLLIELSNAPANPLGQAAWQVAFALFNPISPAPADLPALRLHYVGQIHSLLAAARWAEKPIPQESCSSKMEIAGQPQCFLASNDFYALIDQKRAALLFAFARTPDGNLHELVAPSSQFVTGLSDPTSWDLSRGLFADPSVISGGFPAADASYKLRQEAYSLSFSAQNGQQITYHLIPGGLRIEVKSKSPTGYRIPLALDPWSRFAPGWGDNYKEEKTSSGLAWFLDSQVRVEVDTSGHITTHPFNESIHLMSSMEDPNRDYPPGHFIPFPISLIEIQGEGDYFIEIRI